MNFEFERVFIEAKYSHRIFLNKFTKNFHNFFLDIWSFYLLLFRNEDVLFHFKIMCAENVVITKVIGFS